MIHGHIRVPRRAFLSSQRALRSGEGSANTKGSISRLWIITSPSEGLDLGLDN